MSSCIKDLFGYDLVKKCPKCGIISLKANFHKQKTTEDSLRLQCKLCRKQEHKIIIPKTEKRNQNIINSTIIKTKKKLQNIRNYIA